MFQLINKNKTMKGNLLIILFTTMFSSCISQSSSNNNEMKKYNPLSETEKYVILQKGTDRPYTGKYTDLFDKGIYICRQCNNPLYLSDDKFHSNCGWPSFDDEIEGAVKRIQDADGRRTEIICNNCNGHLGHVFIGEGFTEKQTRHCVNTTSLIFIPSDELEKAPKVIK